MVYFSDTSGGCDRTTSNPQRLHYAPLWWDESEGGDTSASTLPFIVISKDAQESAGGKPFASSVEYSHSSFLRTMQVIFDVDPDDGFPWLGEAVIAHDLSALFKPGTLK